MAADVNILQSEEAHRAGETVVGGPTSTWARAEHGGVSTTGEAAGTPRGRTGLMRGSSEFRAINRAYNSVFRANRLSLGLVAPIENYGNNNAPDIVDLAENPNAPARPIHLGFQLGVNRLRDYLRSRKAIGVNHVALNLRFNRSEVEATMKRLADALLPEFGEATTQP